MLPMMQSWLRRGSRCYGYWNTGLNSFKQCCGLVADLVVEFVARFSGEFACQSFISFFFFSLIVMKHPNFSTFTDDHGHGADILFSEAFFSIALCVR